MFSTLLTGKLAVGLAAGVVVVTGAATAAYAHVLPNQSHHANVAAAFAGTGVVAAGGDHDQDADDVSASASATPSVSVTASVSATATATPTTTPSPRPVNLRHACEEFTEAAAGGKAVNPTDLAALVKAAGSSTAIAAYCAALPVPPKCVTTTPTPTPTATPSPTPTVTVNTATDADGDGTDADKDGKEGGKFGKDDGKEGLKCGICPVVTATPSATVTPTTTAAATKRIDIDEMCGDPDGDHKGKLDPSKTPKPMPSMFTQHPPLWFDRNTGPGVGSTHNIVPLGGANNINNGSQGKPANGPQGKHGR